MFILNASDLKPYLLSLSAAMAFAFSPEAAGPDASSFIQRWSAQHFGAAAGTSVAVAYEGYAAVADTATSDYSLVIAIQNLADAMLSKAVVGDFNFTSLRPGAGAILNASSATVAKWQSLSRKSAAVLSTLPQRTRQMFTGHCLAQQYLLGNATLALERLAAAALATSVEDSLGAARASEAAMDGGCNALLLAEGTGRWAGYFAHDRLVDIHHSRRLLSQLVSALGKKAVLPSMRPFCACTGGVHDCNGSIPYSQCPDLFANQVRV